MPAHKHCMLFLFAVDWHRIQIGNGPGQFLGLQVIIRVFIIRLVQWLSWVSATKDIKKKSNNGIGGSMKQAHFWISKLSDFLFA